MFIFELESAWEIKDFWNNGMKFQARMRYADSNSLYYTKQIIVEPKTITDPFDPARARTLEGFKVVFRSHRDKEAQFEFAENADEGLQFLEKVSHYLNQQDGR